MKISVYVYFVHSPANLKNQVVIRKLQHVKSCLLVVGGKSVYVLLMYRYPSDSSACKLVYYLYSTSL